MGSDGRVHAAETAARMLHDNDVTYVAQGANGESARDWRLDMLPLLMAPNEWHALETGLIQRARLLNMIVADLYGPQQLLKSRSLPPALVFGNPEFLLPCHGVGTRDGTFLHLLAFDLGRAPDGQWWVLSNRTQAPSGAGYALENRIITSRCLPDMFANCNVHRLAPFFRGFSENLLPARWPRRSSCGRVVAGPEPELFRACVSRPLSRLPDRRRAGSDRPCRPRLSEDAGRTQTRRARSCAVSNRSCAIRWS